MLARATGWRLDDILSLPVTRFLAALAIVKQQREEEERASWRHAAFIGWQVVSALGAQISFREYLRKIGLKDTADG